MKGLSALPYFGGKSTSDAANAGVGKWVANLLPAECQMYVETHAGMLGVLLSRKPVYNEFANDLNGRVINWWRVVRFQDEELRHAFKHTPIADDVYLDFKASLDDGDELERALKFMYVVTFSLHHADGAVSKQLPISPKMPMRQRIGGLPDRLSVIKARIEGVHFTNRPALDLLDRFKDEAGAVVYVDPPYRDRANTSPYAVVQQDHEDTLQALLRMKGRVAVSGYGSDWDELEAAGWTRTDYRTHTVVGLTQLNSEPGKRTESLWTNFVPETQGVML